tara:strand:- start:371 stop:526 length:156 start_codon:yes stop_codon:yes gene_type:complete
MQQAFEYFRIPLIILFLFFFLAWQLQFLMLRRLNSLASLFPQYLFLFPAGM